MKEIIKNTKDYSKRFAHIAVNRKIIIPNKWILKPTLKLISN